jgi:hypothetical protein
MINIVIRVLRFKDPKSDDQLGEFEVSMIEKKRLIALILSRFNKWHESAVSTMLLAIVANEMVSFIMCRWLRQ